MDFNHSFNKPKYDISYLQHLLNSNSKHGLTGSINLGNTCYMNSAIACLSNTLELTNYFLTRKYEKDINENNQAGLKGRLVREWYKLLYKYWIENNKEGNPKNLRAIMGEIDKRFNLNEQQDSFEFLAILIDKIQEELNKVSKKSYEVIDKQKENETDIECAKRFWNYFVKRNNSIITDLFTGQCKSTTKCPFCQNVAITYETFNTLTLPIPDDNFLKQNKNNVQFKDTIIFYIPKLNFGNIVKIKFSLPVNAKLHDVVNYLNKIKDFKYQINSLDFMGIRDRFCVGIIQRNQMFFFKFDGFLFCSEKDNANCDKIIPLYIIRKLGHKKEYIANPRFLYVNKNMKYYDFLKKIYCIGRKYFKNPFDKNKNDPFESTYRCYLSNPNKYYKVLIDLIEEEFRNIFENPISQSKDFRNNLPFSIYMNNEINKREFIGKNQNSLFLNGNNSISDIIDSFLNINPKLEYKLVLKIILDSPYTKNDIKFNKCEEIISDDFGNNKFEYSNSINLNDCFRFYMKEETLGKGNEWFCKICQESRLAKRKIDLFYLPKFLIISLKRFSNVENQLIKDRQYIDFPIKDMDLSDYVLGPEKKKSKYDLYAVCRHFGSCDSGHYTALCQNIDNKWYQYNDSIVNEIDENEINTAEAYVLFFRRKYD